MAVLVVAFGAGVASRYAPYDLPWSVRATLRRLRPALLVIMETELWPNLLNECARARVPVIIASARLSARSQSRWSRFGALLQPALAQLLPWPTRRLPFRTRSALSRPRPCRRAGR